MDFAEYVTAHSDKPLTDEQRVVLSKYEQQQLGDKTEKLSIIPDGKAEAWLKEWWAKYQESKENLFEDVGRKTSDKECSGCRERNSLETCHQCDDKFCEECSGVCHICGDVFCVEECLDTHGCELY